MSIGDFLESLSQAMLVGTMLIGRLGVRPVHLLRVLLLRVLESNFPGDSLYNYMDMIVPTP